MRIALNPSCLNAMRRYCSTYGVFLIAALWLTAPGRSFSQTTESADSQWGNEEPAGTDLPSPPGARYQLPANATTQLVGATSSGAEVTQYLREKLKAQNKMGNTYARREKYARAMEYYDSAQHLADELGDKPLQAYTRHRKAELLFQQGAYAEGLRQHREGLRINKETGDKKAIARSHYYLGNYFKQLAAYPDALSNFFDCYRLRAEIGDKRGSAWAYNKIAIIYSTQAKHADAVAYFTSSLRLFEEIGSKGGIGWTYYNLAYLEIEQHNLAKASWYLTNAVDLFKAVDERQGLSAAVSRLGDLYRLEGKGDLALKNYLKALHLRFAINDKSGVAASLRHIGKFYQETGRSAEAMSYYLRALKIERENGNKIGSTHSYVSLGNLHTELGSYAKARDDYEQVLVMSKRYGFRDQIKAAHQGLAKIYRLQGNYKEAYVHFSLYTRYKDSLFNETTHQQVTEITERYQSEKKDREIQQLAYAKQNLEAQQQITSLSLKTKQDSLAIAQAAALNMSLDNDRMRTVNLYNGQQITLLSEKQQLQQLRIDKEAAELARQKAESEQRQATILLLAREKELQAAKLKRETALKNYSFALTMLLLALSFFAYNYYRTRQRLKLQTLRNKLAADLHDDLGSTLSSISILAQMARQRPAASGDMLRNIEESSRSMVDAVSDLIWTVNPENDEFEHILLRMRSFAGELLGATQTEFDFSTDEETARLKLPMDVRRNLYLIFKEATNNMVKYAHAQKAQFSIRGTKNYLTMLIQDDGRGFDTKKAEQGNGLGNMRMRAEEIGARFKLESGPGTGTSIELQLSV
jgi:two-component system, NarL family, sensor histidine kinase UhpB